MAEVELLGGTVDSRSVEVGDLYHVSSLFLHKCWFPRNEIILTKFGEKTFFPLVPDISRGGSRC